MVMARLSSPKLGVGSRCILENAHRCTVRYEGETGFATGNWVGVELDKSAGVFGKNNGEVAGVRYFTCPERMGLFVRASRLALDISPGGRAELELELPDRKLPAGSGRNNNAGPAQTQASTLSSASKPPTFLPKLDSTGKRKKAQRRHTALYRSQSSIDPTHVSAARAAKQKLTPTEKRNRNKSVVGLQRPNREGLSPAEQDEPGLVRSGSMASLVRESEMRKDIMRLQQEHLKTLIEENRHLVEENNMLLGHAAELQSQQWTASLENIKLKRSASESQEGSAERFTEILSERNLAVEKLASLMEEVRVAKRTIAELRSELRRPGTEPTVAEPDDGAAAGRVLKLKRQNEKLNTKLKGMEKARIVGEVSDLLGTRMMHQSVSEAYEAAVERLAELTVQNSELTEQLAAKPAAGAAAVAVAGAAPAAGGSKDHAQEIATLKQQRDEAIARVNDMTAVVKSLSSGADNAQLRQRPAATRSVQCLCIAVD